VDGKQELDSILVGIDLQSSLLRGGELGGFLLETLQFPSSLLSLPLLAPPRRLESSQ
jgi:hypothetical protein